MGIPQKEMGKSSVLFRVKKELELAWVLVYRVRSGPTQSGRSHRGQPWTACAISLKHGGTRAQQFAVFTDGQSLLSNMLVSDRDGLNHESVQPACSQRIILWEVFLEPSCVHAAGMQAKNLKHLHKRLMVELSAHPLPLYTDM